MGFAIELSTTKRFDLASFALQILFACGCSKVELFSTVICATIEGLLAGVAFVESTVLKNVLFAFTVPWTLHI